MVFKLVSVVVRHVIAHYIFVKLGLVHYVWSVRLASSAKACVRLCKHAYLFIWSNTECILASRNFIALKLGVISRLKNKAILEVKM